MTYDLRLSLFVAPSFSWESNVIACGQSNSFCPVPGPPQVLMNLPFLSNFMVRLSLLRLPRDLLDLLAKVQVLFAGGEETQ